MNPLVVFATYALASILALALLYRFGPAAWYWHVLSVVAAFAIGLYPLQPEWVRPELDLTIGFTFTFLVMWGVCGPFYQMEHWVHRHHHP